MSYHEASDIVLVSHGGKIELLISRLISMYGRVGYTVEYNLRPGSFNLIDIVTDGEEIIHLRILCMNCNSDMK
jgi:hypothetical protein